MSQLKTRIPSLRLLRGEAKGTVGDSLDVHKLEPNDDDLREVLMLARLAEVSPDDLKQMSMKDFRRLQKGYLRLVASDKGEDEGFVELAA